MGRRENFSHVGKKLHKNTEGLKIFKRMKQNRFNQSDENWYLKVKKLHQLYLRIRDVLQKRGSSSDINDSILTQVCVVRRS